MDEDGEWNLARPVRYLEKSKKAAFVVRVVLDEYSIFEKSNEIVIAGMNPTKQYNVAYDLG